MLTSSANQYLRPEYLTPLPTTLDAKKSPLALLAQTCSQIGADPPNGKSLLGTLDSGKTSSSGKTSKSSSEQQSRDKTSPSSGAPAPQSSTDSVRSSFKPYESCLGREKASSPEEQRAASSHSASGRSRTPGSKRCSSNQSASSARAATPQGRRTVTPNGETTRESPASRSGSVSAAAAAAAASEASSASQGQAGSPMQSKSIYSPAGVLAMTDPSIKDLPLGTFKPGSTMPVSTSAAYLGYPQQLPIDVMASSLMSQHHAALKNGLASNPYLSYARMKTSSGVDALVPICRDPFCTGCQLNPHFLAASSANAKVPTSTAGSCPAGCAQCDHKPLNSPYAPMSAHTAAAYAHAQLAALAAASQLPFVCNWMAGDTAYCGKRFSSSEELLQHLRSHTSLSAGDPSAAAALSLLSPSGLPPGHPLLSRSYPTPPLSPLAAGRYHPYGKPSNMMQPSLSSLGLALPPHHPAAGLPPYFSPYSLYGGPRLGAASGMHP